jgi:hypothetical protein
MIINQTPRKFVSKKKSSYETDFVRSVELRGDKLYCYMSENSGPVIFDAKKLTPLMYAKVQHMIARGA